jgi:hypothetical protein
MRVLAAAFVEPGGATRVLRELRRRFGLAPGDAAVAPLGTAGMAVAKTVFAGRFEDENVPEVRRVVAEHGGEVVSEVDERWTRSATR